ncbi:MAG: Spo0B domain-containing protein [Brevibacillus sp.]|nr:Spo0B domain-containing protein [Brevibacillus sp.]
MSEQKLFTEQADLLLHYLNQQRHDWLNHFQVLLGYLKLGRVEEGEAYLRRITQEIQQESAIARINCPPLSVFFLTFHALHHDIRLQVEVEQQLDLARLAIEQETFCRLVFDLVFALKNHAEDAQDEQPSLLVSLRDGKDHVLIRFDLIGRVKAAGSQAVELALRSVRDYGVAVLERVHNDKEWILEISIPCRT